MRMVTGVVILAAGHRREEGDLAGTGDSSVGFHMGMVDGGADHLRLVEGMGVGFVACGEPGDEIADRAHICRRLDGLFGLADALAHPGEIFHLQFPSSSRTWWMPCRK